ncbi:membrane protein insertase YidC [Actinomyces minihominis]|uniref:membrane protein insertase YidC n=1 Tax=Actinomyces minihominis TaxID=2002838 RepID=UPI000C074CA4|nr:membrane protein insertase YidC [Actinomyces minihominis]
MDSILHPIIVAFAWIWVSIYRALTFIGIPEGPGIGWVLSIVILTVLVRFAILPLYIKQTKSMRSMQVLQPEMQKITAKYKGKKDSVSRQRQSEETMALYKKHGASPYASCLPLLVQMPILFALYRVFYSVSQIMDGTYGYDALGPLNAALASDVVDSTVFGVGLSQTLSTTPGIGHKAVFIVLIAFLVGMQFLTMRLSMKKNMAPNPDPNNPMVRSQKTMMYIMPLMFVFTGFIFQMGLLVYMVTTTTFGFFQQVWVNRTMPNPGSPAFEDLLSHREAHFQKWAAPTFESYEKQYAALDGDEEAIASLQSETLASVEKHAGRQHIYRKFPDDWTISEKLGVYRTLALEPWKSIPDEIWMKQLVIAKASKEQVEAARKNRPKKLSREQRMRIAERERVEREAAEKRAQRNAKKSASSSSKGGLTPEEIERRRQQRRKESRNQGKKS